MTLTKFVRYVRYTIFIEGYTISYIEDIYFFEVHTKYISSCALKILMFSTHA